MMFSKKPVSQQSSLVKAVVVRVAAAPYTNVNNDIGPTMGFLCMLGNVDVPIYIETTNEGNAHTRFLMAGDFIDVRKVITIDGESETIRYTLERNVSLIDNCQEQKERLLEALGREET